MRFETMFRFLVATEAEDLGATERQHLAGILQGLAAHGLTVTQASSLADAAAAMRADASIGGMLVEWGASAAFGDVRGFLRNIRAKGLEMPIFLLAHRHKFAEIDAENLTLVSGYVFAGEDTPEFIAKNLADHLVHYAQSLKPPFFGAMVDYAEQGNQLWTCPGHNGGVFYRKSPGR